MELILSNLEPARFSSKSQKDIWNDGLRNADLLKIATGYVSTDALVELKKVIELNAKPSLELLIGMHYFDKFTKPQYEAVKELDFYLQNNSRGSVYLSDKRRFHGKMCSFIKDSNCFGAVVGSSNLASISGISQSLYEVDCYFNSSNEMINVDTAISNLIDSLGTPFAKIPTITDFNTGNSLLENHYGVTKVSRQEYAEILSKRTDVDFEIPAKTEPKSNLNVFFGKGRVNQKGFEMPRPWYEVEIIVSKQITELDSYPKERVFTVITDDLWSFKCSSNGAYSKNFRSSDDLKILGKWIKGRLEDSGALKIGQPVTEDVLRIYGNNILKLSATSDPEVWLLDFKGR